MIFIGGGMSCSAGTAVYAAYGWSGNAVHGMMMLGTLMSLTVVAGCGGTKKNLINVLALVLFTFGYSKLTPNAKGMAWMTNRVQEFKSDCEYRTKYFYAESDWHRSLREAEVEAEDRYDDEREVTLSEIRARGGFIVSEVVGGTMIDRSTDANDDDIFQVSRSGEIEYGWCEDFDAPLDIIALSASQKRSISSDVKYYSAEKRLIAAIQKKHPEKEVLIDDALTFNTYSYGSISALNAVHGEVNAKDPIPHPIPELIDVENWEVINCQSTSQNRKKDFKYEETSGQRVVFSKKTTSRRGLRASISFKGFGASGSVDRSIELNNSRTYDYTERKSRSYSMSLEVNPYKHLKAKLIYSQRQAIVPFSGWILFSGAAVLHVRQHRHGRTLRSWSETRPIESLLSESERKLKVDGHVENINEITIQEKFDELDADCDIL